MTTKSGAPSAFEPQKENDSALANGALTQPTDAFLKESTDDDAKLLRSDGKVDNAESSAELMQELQVHFAISSFM